MHTAILPRMFAGVPLGPTVGSAVAGGRRDGIPTGVRQDFFEAARPGAGAPRHATHDAPKVSPGCASGGASPLCAATAAGAGVASGGQHVPMWKRIAHYMMHSAHLVLEGAEMANILTGAAVGGAIGAGIISIGMTALGVSHIVDGVRNKSGEQIMEGIGATLIGTKSGMEAIILGSEHSHGLLTQVAHGVHSSMTPLGVAHGGAEALLGAYRVYDGLRHKNYGQATAGALTVGLGASVCAASLGAGMPAILAAGAFLTGRIIWEERASFRQAVNGALVAPKGKWTYFN